MRVKREKVYCKDCEWHTTHLYGIFAMYAPGCEHRKREVKDSEAESCGWYTRKWWKFWIK